MKKTRRQDPKVEQFDAKLHKRPKTFPFTIRNDVTDASNDTDAHHLMQQPKTFQRHQPVQRRLFFTKIGLGFLLFFRCFGSPPSKGKDVTYRRTGRKKRRKPNKKLAMKMNESIAKEEQTSTDFDYDA